MAERIDISKSLSEISSRKAKLENLRKKLDFEEGEEGVVPTELTDKAEDVLDKALFDNYDVLEKLYSDDVLLNPKESGESKTMNNYLSGNAPKEKPVPFEEIIEQPSPDSQRALQEETVDTENITPESAASFSRAFGIDNFAGFESPQSRQVAEQFSWKRQKGDPTEKLTGQKFETVAKQTVSTIEQAHEKLSNLFNDPIKMQEALQNGDTTEVVGHFSEYKAYNDILKLIKNNGFERAAQTIAGLADELDDEMVYSGFDPKSRAKLREIKEFKDRYLEAIQKVSGGISESIFNQYVGMDDQGNPTNEMIQNALADFPPELDDDYKRSYIELAIIDAMEKKYDKDVVSYLDKNVAEYVHKHFDELFSKHRKPLTAEKRIQQMYDLADLPVVREMLTSGKEKLTIPDLINSKESPIKDEGDKRYYLNKMVAELKADPARYGMAEVITARVFGNDFNKYYNAQLVTAYVRNTQRFNKQHYDALNNLITKVLPEEKGYKFSDNYGDRKDLSIRKRRYYEREEAILKKLEERVKAPGNKRLVNWARSKNPEYSPNEGERRLYNYLKDSLKVEEVKHVRVDNPKMSVEAADIMNAPFMQDSLYRQDLIKTARETRKKAGKGKGLSATEQLMGEMMPLATGRAINDMPPTDRTQFALDQYSNNEIIKRLNDPKQFPGIIKFMSEVEDEVGTKEFEEMMGGKKVADFFTTDIGVVKLGDNEKPEPISTPEEKLMEKKKDETEAKGVWFTNFGVPWEKHVPAINALRGATNLEGDMKDIQTFVIPTFDKYSKMLKDAEAKNSVLPTAIGMVNHIYGEMKKYQPDIIKNKINIFTEPDKIDDVGLRAKTEEMLYLIRESDSDIAEKLLSTPAEINPETGRLSVNLVPSQVSIQAAMTPQPTTTVRAPQQKNKKVNDIIAQTMGKPTAGVAHQGAVESPIAAREEPIPEKQEIVESPEVKAKKLNRNKILAGLTPKFNDILKDAPDDPSIKAFAQGVIDVIKESKPIDWETVKDRLINIREKYPEMGNRLAQATLEEVSAYNADFNLEEPEKAQEAPVEQNTEEVVKPTEAPGSTQELFQEEIVPKAQVNEDTVEEPISEIEEIEEEPEEETVKPPKIQALEEYQKSVKSPINEQLINAIKTGEGKIPKKLASALAKGIIPDEIPLLSAYKVTTPEGKEEIKTVSRKDIAELNAEHLLKEKQIPRAIYSNATRFGAEVMEKIAYYPQLTEKKNYESSLLKDGLDKLGIMLSTLSGKDYNFESIEDMRRQLGTQQTTARMAGDKFAKEIITQYNIMSKAGIVDKTFDDLFKEEPIEPRMFELEGTPVTMDDKGRKITSIGGMGEFAWDVAGHEPGLIFKPGTDLVVKKKQTEDILEILEPLKQAGKLSPEVEEFYLALKTSDAIFNELRKDLAETNINIKPEDLYGKTAEENRATHLAIQGKQVAETLQRVLARPEVLETMKLYPESVQKLIEGKDNPDDALFEENYKPFVSAAYEALYTMISNIPPKAGLYATIFSQFYPGRVVYEGKPDEATGLTKDFDSDGQILFKRLIRLAKENKEDVKEHNEPEEVVNTDIQQHIKVNKPVQTPGKVSDDILSLNNELENTKAISEHADDPNVKYAMSDIFMAMRNPEGMFEIPASKEEKKRLVPNYTLLKPAFEALLKHPNIPDKDKEELRILYSKIRDKIVPKQNTEGRVYDVAGFSTPEKRYLKWVENNKPTKVRVAETDDRGNIIKEKYIPIEEGLEAVKDDGSPDETTRELARTMAEDWNDYIKENGDRIKEDFASPEVPKLIKPLRNVTDEKGNKVTEEIPEGKKIYDFVESLKGKVNKQSALAEIVEDTNTLLKGMASKYAKTESTKTGEKVLLNFDRLRNDAALLKYGIPGEDGKIPKVYTDLQEEFEDLITDMKRRWIDKTKGEEESLIREQAINEWREKQKLRAESTPEAYEFNKKKEAEFMKKVDELSELIHKQPIYMAEGQTPELKAKTDEYKSKMDGRLEQLKKEIKIKDTAKGNHDDLINKITGNLMTNPKPGGPKVKVEPDIDSRLREIRMYIEANPSRQIDENGKLIEVAENTKGKGKGKKKEQKAKSEKKVEIPNNRRNSMVDKALEQFNSAYDIARNPSSDEVSNLLGQLKLNAQNGDKAQEFDDNLSKLMMAGGVTFNDKMKAELNKLKKIAHTPLETIEDQGESEIEVIDEDEQIEEEPVASKTTEELQEDLSGILEEYVGEGFSTRQKNRYVEVITMVLKRHEDLIGRDEAINKIIEDLKEDGIDVEHDDELLSTLNQLKTSEGREI